MNQADATALAGELETMYASIEAIKGATWAGMIRVVFNTLSWHTAAINQLIEADGDDAIVEGLKSTGTQILSDSISAYLAMFVMSMKLDDAMTSEEVTELCISLKRDFELDCGMLTRKTQEYHSKGG